MTYRDWGPWLLALALPVALAGCGDDDDVGSALDAMVDAGDVLDGAAGGSGEDAAFDAWGPEPEAGPTDHGDASSDAMARDAETDGGDDAGSAAGDAAMDAELPDLDAGADAASDAAGPDLVDPHALSAEIDYQVRCLDCVPTAPDGPARRIRTGVNDPDIVLECEVSQRGVERFASFSIRHSDDDFSLELRDARIGSADPGPQCQVRVKEGGHEYRGACAAVGSPSSHPCRVQLSIDDADLTGSLRCERIQHALNATMFRYVVAAGTANEPATFAVRNCDVPDASVGDDAGGP